MENIITLNSKAEPVVEFLCLPCHSKAVERAVINMFESGQIVCDSIVKEVYVRAKFDSRTNMPKSNTKSSVIWL